MLGQQPIRLDALRLHPKEGDKRTATMTMKMSMDMDLGGNSQTMKMPPMKLVMESEVKKATGDGDIIFESTVTEAAVEEDADVMPQIAEAMKTAIGGVKGMRVINTMSTRGINQQTEVKGGADMTPQLKQQMEQMKSALGNTGIGLPEEPVGLGAKWEVKQQVDSQGMKLDQTTIYELIALDGDKVTAKTTLKQVAENQTINNPSMPQTKVEVRRLTSAGSGETTFDLSQVLPVKSVLKMKNDTDMAMDMGGQNMDMTMKMDMTVTLESK